MLSKPGKMQAEVPAEHARAAKYGRSEAPQCST